MNNELNLLIVGNGFDKASGLASSFSDFVKNNYPNISNILVAIEKDLKNSKTNNNLFFEKIDSSSYPLLLLFIIVYSYGSGFKNNNILWMDVEKILEIVFASKGKFSELRNIYNRLKERKTYQLFENITSYMSEIIAKFYLPTMSDFETYEEFCFYMEKQIKIFEQFFAEYLALEIQNTSNKDKYPSYDERAEDLFYKIVGYENVNNTKVINFNYTEPKCFKNSVENVHGRLLVKNAIIGIDSTKIDVKKDEYIFTKTYRKVEDFTSHGNVKRVNDILNTKFHKIYFYGHSLGEQDYSYFQSIFDRQNIYDNSQVILIFCYSIYDAKIEDYIKTNIVKSVCSLIEKYGKTFDNKRHGKNLLHKLLTEGRLIIKEVI